MRKIKYTLGLLIPSIAINAIAHDLIKVKIQNEYCDINELQKTLSNREKEVLQLYSQSSPHERAVFLCRVIESSSINPHISFLSAAQIRQRIESILLLPDEEQEAEIIKEIRCGGVRWGSIGAPSEKSI